MRIKIKEVATKGLHQYRFAQNPEEERFADAWARQNVLRYLLGDHYAPTERDEVVAATVVQWLGSPVGQAFLEELGYVKEET